MSLAANCKIINKSGLLLDAYEDTQFDLIYHLNGELVNLTEWSIQRTANELIAIKRAIFGFSLIMLIAISVLIFA